MWYSWCFDDHGKIIFHEHFQNGTFESLNPDGTNFVQSCEHWKYNVTSNAESNNEWIELATKWPHWPWGGEVGATAIGHHVHVRANAQVIRHGEPHHGWMTHRHEGKVGEVGRVVMVAIGKQRRLFQIWKTTLFHLLFNAQNCQAEKFIFLVTRNKLLLSSSRPGSKTNFVVKLYLKINHVVITLNQLNETAGWCVDKVHQDYRCTL